jgi:hypothetical protein
MRTAYGSDSDLRIVRQELSLFHKMSKSSSELRRGSSGNVVVVEDVEADDDDSFLDSGLGVTVSSISASSVGCEVVVLVMEGVVVVAVVATLSFICGITAIFEEATAGAVSVAAAAAEVAIAAAAAAN